MSINKSKGNFNIGGLYLSIIECLKICSILYSIELVSIKNMNEIYNEIEDILNK